MNKDEILDAITEEEIIHEGGKDLGNGMITSRITKTHFSPQKLAAFLAEHLSPKQLEP